MSSELATAVEQLLIGVEETQVELRSLYQAKREAIRKADRAALERLTEAEQRLVAHLQGQLRNRHQLLQQVPPGGVKADSLETLVRSMEVPQRERLLERIERTRRAADANRRESWVVWIVARQSLRFFDEILDLIAQGGRKNPVYTLRPETEVSFGGSILDASA